MKHLPFINRETAVPRMIPVKRFGIDSPAPLKCGPAISAAVAALLFAGNAAGADLGVPAPAAYLPPVTALYDWTGFYVGAHAGYSWGGSTWSAKAGGAPIGSGSFRMGQYNFWDEYGSEVQGVQAGYNYMLPNRIVLGAETDVSFSPLPNLTNGLTRGGQTALLNGAESYQRDTFASGTLRARLGYAPGNWLYYATAGLAWTSDQFTVTQSASGAAQSLFGQRLGAAAGVGVEAPIMPNWTLRAEYLYTTFGRSTEYFASTGQSIASNLDQHQVRLGLNYQMGDGGVLFGKDNRKLADMVSNDVNIHGQLTAVWQGYGAFRSPYEGAYSLPGAGQGRETLDASMFVGYRPWQGGEIWVNPEFDQGTGLAGSHGVAAFLSAEAYKFGQTIPYNRIDRAFLRQTFNLGGQTENVAADLMQFAGTQTSDRVVLTIGRFSPVDVFDTNRYSNNPKTDFLNWGFVNAGTFDYACDPWAFGYGAAAEWYKDRYTVRAGVFDLTTTPQGGISPYAVVFDPTWHQFSLTAEIEERHELWGQPGKVKVTAFVDRGNLGSLSQAVALAQQTGQPANINAVRFYQSRPGVSLNIEQQITPDFGFFSRLGWAGGKTEAYEYSDIDYTAKAGFALNGNRWGRPNDTIGVGYEIDGLSKDAITFFNAGGLGIVIGDGQLPHYATEKVIEAYYSYAISDSMKVTADYQYVQNPGYNTDRGPVSVFAGRLHLQF